MIPDARTTRVIHDAMIQDELERNGPAHLRRVREPFPIGNPFGTLRGVTARAMVGLARRIEPAPHDGHVPACREGASA